MSLQDSRQISDVKVMLKKGADGEGISSIEKTGTSGLVDTYTITFTGGSKTTFTVTNGKAISNIAKTSTSGLVDTYTITYNDGTTDTFEVTNGNGIANIAKTGTSGNVDTYTVTCTNGDTYTFTVTNGTGSTLSSLSDVEITNPQDGDLLEYDSTEQKWKNKSQWKTFATATDAEIAEMVALADAGQIDLYSDCGWRVGQEHTTTIGAISSSGSFDGVSWSVGESQSAQEITLVLMHRGLYELVTPVLSVGGASRSVCSFVVGIKNCLSSAGYMNDSNTNSGSWDGCKRRNWCNGGFRSAIPSVLRDVFKQFKTITIETYNGSSNKISNDYFALPAEKEVFGSITLSNAVEASALTQFEYFETSSNRQKRLGNSGSSYNGWWERSPRADNDLRFCDVASSGVASGNQATVADGLAPFGCL